MVQPSTRFCVAGIFTFISIVDVIAAVSFIQNLNDLPVENMFDSIVLPESDLFGTNNMDHLSFQNADGNLFSDEPLDPETLSTEANLFTDDFDPAHSTEPDFDDQLIGSTLSFSFADDPSCLGSDVDPSQSFGKQRRANICPSPKTESENEGPEKKTPPNASSSQEFLDDIFQVGQFFKDSEELCPARIFQFSTIPVCSSDSASRIIPQPPFRYSNIWNIIPVLEGEITCRLHDTMWCCADVVKVQHPYGVRISQSPDQIQDIFNAGSYVTSLMALLNNFLLEGKVCYPQIFKQTGVPILDNPNPL